MHSTFNMEDGYMGSGKRIKRSIEKYGLENHIKEILEFLEDRSSLKEREKEIVNEELIKDSLCMNLQPGGGGGFINKEHQLKCSIAGGQRHKEKMLNNPLYKKEQCDRLSKLTKERHKEGKYKMPDWNGRTHSRETKNKISNKHKIRLSEPSNNSQYGTCWITNGKDNKKIFKGDLIPNGWKLGRNMRREKQIR